MKKYLIKGLLALVVGGFTASCADKDGDYVPVGQQKATAYADAFKELIGGEVAPNHDWGFTKTSIVSETAQTRANTRAFTRADGDPEVVKKDQWQNFPDKLDGNTVPADVTKKEAAYVYEWFQKEENKGLTEEGQPWTDFFIQQVYGTMDKQKKGIWHRHDINPQPNGRDWDEEFTDKGGMDYLTVGDGTTMTHVNDFNAETGGPWNIVYMKNSSAMKFGYHGSWDNSDRQLFKLAKITVPGDCFDDGVAREGWYVGLSLLGEKYDNGDKILGEQRKDWGDDWILKIVPGDITPSGGETSSSSTSTRTDRIERRRLVSQGRVFCEDLGTSAERMTKSDIDFNDAVFDAKIWRLGQFDITFVNGSKIDETDYLEGIYDNGLENGKFKYIAEIRLLAAGGTVPLKIGGNNGFEIHAKFGEGNNKTIGHTTIINTMGAPSQANFSTTVSTETCDAVTVEVDITDLVAGNTAIGLDIIPIEVQWVSSTGQTVGELTADFGQAPQKLCVPIGTPWIYERIPVTEAYGDFADYATSRTPLFWDGEKNESLLYPSIPEGMTAETNVGNKVDDNPYIDRVVTEGTTTTTTVTETVLWEGEFKAQSNKGTTSEVFTLYSNDLAVGDVLRVYGEAKGNDANAELTIQAAENGTVSVASCTVSSPYTDIPVTQDIIDKLTKKVTFWGRNCIVTKLSKVATTTN